MPNSTVTNGAVAEQVQKVEGDTVQVKSKDGERRLSSRATPKSSTLSLAVKPI